jgi:type 1 fimbriae regulatory protein FimB
MILQGLWSGGLANRVLQDFMEDRDPRHTARYTRTASRRFEDLWR